MLGAFPSPAGFAAPPNENGVAAGAPPAAGAAAGAVAPKLNLKLPPAAAGVPAGVVDAADAAAGAPNENPPLFSFAAGVLAPKADCTGGVPAGVVVFAAPPPPNML